MTFDFFLLWLLVSNNCIVVFVAPAWDHFEHRLDHLFIIYIYIKHVHDKQRVLYEATTLDHIYVRYHFVLLWLGWTSKAVHGISGVTVTVLVASYNSFQAECCLLQFELSGIDIHWIFPQDLTGEGNDHHTVCHPRHFVGCDAGGACKKF